MHRGGFSHLLHHRCCDLCKKFYAAFTFLGTDLAYTGQKHVLLHIHTTVSPKSLIRQSRIKALKVRVAQNPSIFHFLASFLCFNTILDNAKVTLT